MTKMIKRGITLGLGLVRKNGKALMGLALGVAGAFTVACRQAYASVSTTTIATQVDNIGDTIWSILTDIILSKVFLLVVGVVLIAFLIRFAINWLRSGGRRA